MGLEPEPSVLPIPVIAVAPVTVILDKSLFVIVLIEPFGELPLVVKPVIVPPAPVLENPVTIRLLLMVCVPAAGIV